MNVFPAVTELPLVAFATVEWVVVDPCALVVVLVLDVEEDELADDLATVFVVAAAAGAVLTPSIADNGVSELVEETAFTTTSAPARDGAAVTDGPAPWIRITAATTAVARTTAFFNVCTPIQRLHCPPN